MTIPPSFRKGVFAERVSLDLELVPSPDRVGRAALVLIIQIFALTPELRVLLIGQVYRIECDLELVCNIIEGGGINIRSALEPSRVRAHRITIQAGEPASPVAERRACTKFNGLIIDGGIVTSLRKARQRAVCIHTGKVCRCPQLVKGCWQEEELTLCDQFKTFERIGLRIVHRVRKVLNQCASRGSRDSGVGNTGLAEGNIV